MKALQSSFPDVQEDEEQPKAKGFYFPKPISEAPSPTSTRATSPVSSTQVCTQFEYLSVMDRVPKTYPGSMEKWSLREA